LQESAVQGIIQPGILAKVANNKNLRKGGKRFAPVMTDRDGILRSVAVPGFWIDVAWLWPSERFIPVRQALTRIRAA
jgi:hypothetical protein